jgi:hypothetical protein
MRERRNRCEPLSLSIYLDGRGGANLNGPADAADFLRVRASYGRPGTRWDQGNFNYDSATNPLDYAVLRLNLLARA